MSTTDTASLPLSALTPPSDRDEREAWLDERADWLADVMAAELGRLTTEAAEQYASTLTAAGDLSAFDGFMAVWRAFTTEVVGEYAAGMYFSGALTAWVSGPGEDGLSPEEEVAWAAVVNEEALVYQASAVNLVVGLGDEAWTEVRERTVAAIQSGLPNEQLKDEIQSLTGYSEERADRIARTETMRAYNSGDMVGARSLPVDHRPVEKVWIATGDSRTRRAHARANDQVQPLDAPFRVGGERLDRPADPRGSAGNTIHCRCVMEFLYPGDRRPDGSVAGELPPDEVEESPTDSAG